MTTVPPCAHRRGGGNYLKPPRKLFNMSLTDLLTMPITIITTAASNLIDAYGTELPAETSTNVLGYLEQKARSEAEGAVPVESWLLVLPAGTAIHADDQVIVDGESYAVTGPVWPVFNPKTVAVDHIEATLGRTAGGEQGS